MSNNKRNTTRKDTNTKPTAEEQKALDKAEAERIAAEQAEKDKSTQEGGGEGQDGPGDGSEGGDTEEGDAQAGEDQAAVVTIVECFEGCELKDFLVPRFEAMLATALDTGATDGEYQAVSQQFAAVVNVLNNANQVNFAVAIRCITKMIATNEDWSKDIITRVVSSSVHTPIFWQALVRLSREDSGVMNYKAATKCFNNERIEDQLAAVFAEE